MLIYICIVYTRSYMYIYLMYIYDSKLHLNLDSTHLTSKHHFNPENNNNKH